MKISKYLTKEDAAYSSTAIRLHIDNEVPDAILTNVKRTASQYDLIKDKFPDLLLNSFYRCPTLNKKIGGAPSSQHTLGEAIDIWSNDNDALALWIINNLSFDQLIYEFKSGNKWAWIHVSFSDRNRGQVLEAEKVNGKTAYKKIK